MTTLTGSPQRIAEMMGLPEEDWFLRLEASRDWASLVAAPVGDLQETERVFRAIWAGAVSIVVSKPREFLASGLNTPEARAMTGALRAIGANKLADTIEGPPPIMSAPVDTTKLPPEAARRAMLDMMKDEMVAAAWRHGEVHGRREIREFLIRYLHARGVFPLAPARELN